MLFITGTFYLFGKGLSSEEYQSPCLKWYEVVMTESDFYVSRFHSTLHSTMTTMTSFSQMSLLDITPLSWHSLAVIWFVSWSHEASMTGNDLLKGQENCIWRAPRLLSTCGPWFIYWRSFGLGINVLLHFSDYPRKGNSIWLFLLHYKHDIKLADDSPGDDEWFKTIHHWLRWIMS